MSVKVFLASCGIAGSCAGIGVPVLVHEAQQLSRWGKDWVDASNVTSLSYLEGGALDNTLRVSICKALGFSNTTHVNNNPNVDSSGAWIYECWANGNQNKQLLEKLDSGHYEWQLKDISDPVTIRCKSSSKEGSDKVNLELSQCRKK